MPPFEKSHELKTFKQRKCLETRKHEVCTIRSKFPNKIPVIVERYSGETVLPPLDKTKFLVPQEMTMGQFICLLRSRVVLCGTQALFVFVLGRALCCLSSSMAEVYTSHHDRDGFLYLCYASQDAFGAPL
ncbi:microtubule-associated proteins 1A/1B light chain 3C [Amia ocellicauda]|uniref:microtubule-associated proteins 1A/1B light chain 3C n=1 Tax=Amia ocellicauda TaxID=2972642 RepID=UPI003464A7F0